LVENELKCKIMTKVTQEWNSGQDHIYMTSMSNWHVGLNKCMIHIGIINVKVAEKLTKLKNICKITQVY